MKLDKQQALLLSNVLFTYLHLSKSDDFHADVSDFMDQLQDFLLTSSETTDDSEDDEDEGDVAFNEDDDDDDEDEEDASPKIPEDHDDEVTAQKLHNLSPFNGVEFEHKEEDNELSVLVDGYEEFTEVTAVKRTSKFLELFCNGEWLKQPLSKDGLPSAWKKCLPTGKVLLVKDL
jgi:hypothetical protein